MLQNQTTSPSISNATLRLHVLGSGSKGNCSIVEGPEGCIMVDCGFSRKKVRERLEQEGVDPGSIVACLVTHEHSDHVSGVDVVSRWLDIPVLASQGTCQVDRMRTGVANLEGICSRDSFTLAGIQVTTFPTSHDAVDPFGMRFSYGDDALGFVTDTGFLSGEACELLSDVRLLALESNHDVDMLRTGPYPSYLKARIASNEGHLSNGQSCDGLDALLSDRLECVTGMHLSETNNTYDCALSALSKTIARSGLDCRVQVAFQERPVSMG